MSLYTDECMIRDGYAGVPTTRISELVHGYQFDPLAPRSRGRPSPTVGIAAGQPSIVKRPTGTGKFVRPRKMWNVAGAESEQQPPRGVKTKATGEKMKECMEWTFKEAPEHPKDRKVTSRCQRRRATRQEQVEQFAKAYVRTNERSGRTEIMTARKPGSAALELDLNTFDVYESHFNNSSKSPASVIEPKINLGLVSTE